MKSKLKKAFIIAAYGIGILLLGWALVIALSVMLMYTEIFANYLVGIIR